MRIQVYDYTHTSEQGLVTGDYSRLHQGSPRGIEGKDGGYGDEGGHEADLLQRMRHIQQIGIELNAKNIFLIPDEVRDAPDLVKARVADYDLTKWSHATFISQDRFAKIRGCDAACNAFYEYLDGCRKQLTGSQLADFNALMDEFNALNDDYGAILHGFATSMIDLQVEWYLKLR